MELDHTNDVQRRVATARTIEDERFRAGHPSTNRTSIQLSPVIRVVSITSGLSHTTVERSNNALRLLAGYGLGG